MKALITLLALIVVLGVAFVLYRSPPAEPEMTEAEIAQIEAEVWAATDANFEGFRQLDPALAMEVWHRDVSWSWSSRPLNYDQLLQQTTDVLQSFSSYEGAFTPVAVRVLSPDAAVGQFTYECTITYPDGRVVHYPNNVTMTNLMERTPQGWKATLGSQTVGTPEITEAG